MFRELNDCSRWWIGGLSKQHVGGFCNYIPKKGRIQILANRRCIQYMSDEEVR